MDIWLPILLSVGIPLALIAIGFTWGRVNERRHLERLDEREAAVADIVMTDLRLPPASMTNVVGGLVIGESVIATDYWKTLAASLRGLVGGEVGSLGTLVDRARREAMVRMREQARQHGAVMVINVRIDTSEIGGGQAPITEVVAYGTALYPAQQTA